MHRPPLNPHKEIFLVLISVGGSGSVVCIATAYEMDGTEIESRWGKVFRTYPDWPWGPSKLLYNGYRVFPGGESGRGVR
jgi:hypothetical protein